MPSKIRRKNLPVVQRLEQQPGDYSFLQAVRLIERTAIYLNRTSDKTPIALENSVGLFYPSHTENIRFSSNQSLSFPASALAKVKRISDNPRIAPEYAKKRWLFSINFLGLTGATGVLPYHYTELIFERLKLKDESLLDFLDLFNHRAASLFYQASTKYRLPLVYERSQLKKRRTEKFDRHTNLLLSLMGLSTPHIVDGLNIRHESLIHFAGLFCQKVRTASGLKQMLSGYFNVPIEVQEMTGEWQELIDDVRTRLPHKANRKGQNVCLGRSAIMGKKGWFVQGKTRIIIGPLNKEQFEKFAPGSNAQAALNDIVQMYAGSELEFDYKVRIKRGDLPAKIQLKQKEPPTLGWNTWLASRSGVLEERPAHKTMDITLSSKRRH